MKQIIEKLLFVAVVIACIFSITASNAQGTRISLECYKGVQIYSGLWDVNPSFNANDNVSCNLNGEVYFADFVVNNPANFSQTSRIAFCEPSLELLKNRIDQTLLLFTLNNLQCQATGSAPPVSNPVNSPQPPATPTTSASTEGGIRIVSKIHCDSQSMVKLSFEIKCISGTRIDCSKTEFKISEEGGYPILQGGTPAPNLTMTQGSGGVTNYVSIWNNKILEGAQNTTYFTFLVPKCGLHKAYLSYFDKVENKLIVKDIILPSEVPGYDSYGYNAVCWPCSDIEKITIIGDASLFLAPVTPQEPPPEYERPLICGDGECSASAGENNDTCPRDCVCKIDGICDRTDRIISQRYTDTIVEQKWVDGQIVSTPKVVESVYSYTVGGEDEINCPQDCAIPYPMFGVITLPADPVMARSAFLNGMIMSGPEAKTYQYWFTYYPCSLPDLIANTAKASVSLAASGPNGDVSTTVSTQITNLLPDTCYNFRLIGADEKNIIQSGIEMFTTNDKDEVISCPELILPEMDQKINTLTPLLAWTTPTSAKYFSYALYEDDPAGTLRANGLSATSSVQLTSKLNWNKHYYWIVNACSDSSQTNCSGWCQPWHFVTGQLLTAPIIKTPSSTPIFDSNPVISWYPVENAGIYEYTLLGSDNNLIETETTSTTFLLTKNILTKGSYTVKVRACVDASKDNCGPFGIKAFELKDVTDDLDACNSLRIGTQKYEQNISYPFLLKCADGSCPSSYTQVNGQPYNVMQQYPIGSNYNVYLLDEEENIKYESNSQSQLMVGKTYKLIVAPLAMPLSDYADPLLADNGTTSFAQYVSDASNDFKNNNLLNLRDYVDQAQAPFSLGIGIDDPTKKDGFTVNNNTYLEKSIVNGQIYFKALTTTPSAIVPQAEITLLVPKLNSYQTIDNNYYNLGCLKPSEEMKLAFVISPNDDLSIEAEYLGEAIVHIKVTPEKENLIYKLKCKAQYKGQEVLLTARQDSVDLSKFKVILGGKTIDTDATCYAEVYDSEKDKTYQDEVSVPKADIVDEKPLAPTKVKDPYFELCQYPGKVTITWENATSVQQSGYQLKIMSGTTEVLALSNENYLGNSVVINIVDQGDASSGLKYLGTTQSYKAEVKIKMKDSSLWSDATSVSFVFPACQPKIPVISLLKYDQTKSKLYFRGSIGNVGTSCDSDPAWTWHRSDDPVDAGSPPQNDSSDYIIDNYNPGDPIYLRLKFSMGALGTCEAVTSTKYGKNLQMEESAGDVGQ